MLDKFFSSPIFYPGSGFDVSAIPLLLKYESRFIYCDSMPLSSVIKDVSQRLSVMGYHGGYGYRYNGNINQLNVQICLLNNLGSLGLDLVNYKSSYQDYGVYIDDKTEALARTPKSQLIRYSDYFEKSFQILFIECDAEIAFDAMYIKMGMPFNFIIAERYYGPNFYQNGPIFELMKATNKYPKFILTKDEEPDFESYIQIEVYDNKELNHDFKRILYKRVRD